MATCIIPCRYNSKRLPQKVILPILGRPMFAWTYEAAANAGCFKDVWLAVDHIEVAEAADRLGYNVIMTGDCSSGSERVFQAAKAIGIDRPDDILFNLQCDEPTIMSEQLAALCLEMERHPRWQVATLARPIPLHEGLSSNVVKAILSRGSRVHYFTRSRLQHEILYQHIGVYAYRLDALSLHCSLKPSHNEIAENLEQLRLLDNGIPVHAIQTTYRTHAIDTSEDMPIVEHILRSR